MIQLTLTDKNASENAGCGCGGACGCGSAGGHDHGHAHGQAHGHAHAAPEAAVVTRLAVTGMTCQHCVAAVTEELSGLAGVSSVEVDLVAGGTSTVTVRSDLPLAGEVVRSAIDEAGYALA